VLFADLSGYTLLNEALDPEEVARVLNRLKAGATRIIETNGGIVNQFVGDEVMALFGVPRSHDDDPVRAVRAAIELRDHVREIGDELALQLGAVLRMHIGVNTGLMISQLRDQRDGLYGVTGDAINTAARLAEAAGSDEIMIGSDTHRAIGAVFETELVGELRLRGRQELLVAHRVLRNATAIGGTAERATEFVGRNGEMRSLARCFDEVRAGNGRLVGISGEPGIGKSRLCEEFALGLPVEALVLRGRCPPFGSVAPYEPFREVLRSALLSGADEGSEADRVIARVERELPACAEHLATVLALLALHSDAYPLQAADAERSQLAILTALEAVLAGLAQSRPVVVLVADWHWADSASERALDHLAESIAARRLLLLVDFRSYYQPHWDPAAVCLELPPLRADDTRSIVHRIVGGVPDALVQRIFERTGGNPLFVEELCKTLVDLGSVSGPDAEKFVESVVPDNVAAVVRARIDRLPPACRQTLRLASVLGESFSLELLREVCEPEDDVDLALAGLVRTGLLQEQGDGSELRFKHALVRDVAYEMLLLRSRRTLHGAVGCAIERREDGRIHEFVERLAHHFARSDDREKAVLYLVRSGDKAVASGAMLQALGQYAEAVQILAKMPEMSAQMRRRVDITLKLAHAAIYCPSKELREVLRDCLELAERLGDKRAASYAFYWMGFLENALGGWPAARDLFEQGIVRARERRDEKLLSLIYGNLGQTLFHTGDFAEAMRVLEEGVRMRREISGDSAAAPLVSYPITYQAMIHAEAGRFDLAAERLDEATMLARESGRLYTEAAVVGSRALVDLFRGDWPVCRKNAEELERKAKRIGSTFMLAFSQALGGYARCFDGQRAEGIAMLRDGIARLQRTEISMMMSFLYACLAEALVLGGEVEEAESLAARALEHAAREDRSGEPAARRVQLLVAARRAPGERERIEAAYALALAAARRRGSVREELITTFRAAEALLERDPEWASDRLRECVERFRALQMPWYGDRAEVLLARAASR
jgi:class 3 adenylate cyclase/tetratricopeptide (TPR) repeat protein